MSDKQRGVRILARSLARYLTGQGYQQRELLALAAELIDVVARDLSAERSSRARRCSPPAPAPAS
jgi:hypothetical protein